MITILDDLYDHFYDQIQKGKIKRKVKSRIRELRTQYDWFEQMYRDDSMKRAMIHEIQAQNKIMDRDYMNKLDADLQERAVFQEWLRERFKIL